jgi:hypothetical protein
MATPPETPRPAFSPMEDSGARDSDDESRDDQSTTAGQPAGLAPENDVSGIKLGASPSASEAGDKDDDGKQNTDVPHAESPKPVNPLMMTASKELTPAQLYQVYQMKLRSDAGGSESQEQAPKLVNSLVDFLTSFNERLSKLEQKAGIETNKEGGASKTGAAQVDESQVHSVETRFYSVDNQTKLSEEGSKEPIWKIKGSFDSEVDKKHCLRVLFKWTGAGGEKSDDEINAEPPQPDIVDVEEVRIRSEPIATFLEKILAYSVHNNDLVHLRKPFRCLVSEAPAIRDQLQKLERMHHG